MLRDYVCIVVIKKFEKFSRLWFRWFVHLEEMIPMVKKPLCLSKIHLVHFLHVFVQELLWHTIIIDHWWIVQLLDLLLHIKKAFLFLSLLSLKHPLSVFNFKYLFLRLFWRTIMQLLLNLLEPFNLCKQIRLKDVLMASLSLFKRTDFLLIFGKQVKNLGFIFTTVLLDAFIKYCSFLCITIRPGWAHHWFILSCCNYFFCAACLAGLYSWLVFRPTSIFCWKSPLFLFRLNIVEITA